MKLNYHVLLFLFCAPVFLLAQDTTKIIGKVNGISISLHEFETTLEEAPEYFLPTEKINYTWNFLVNKTLLHQIAKQLGLSISKEEMEELLYSNDPNRMSPVILRQLGNPMTGRVDTWELKRLFEFHSMGDYSNYSKAQQEEFKFFKKKIDYLIETVKTDHKASKFGSLMQGAAYTPSWMHQFNAEQAYLLDFNYIQIPYSAIKNEEINLSKEELNAYLKQHKKEYDGPAQASIEYLKFPIEASTEDKASILDQAKQIVRDFKKTKDDSIFVAQQNGTIQTGFKTIDEIQLDFQLDESIAKKISTSRIAAVVGPYEKQPYYEIFKVLQKTIRPDSVRTRHILIRSNHDNEIQPAFHKIDSIKNLIVTKALSFEEAAQLFSQDGSRDIGGDLGWRAKDGAFVQEFEDYMFSDAKIGVLNVVKTQFGIHLVEITDKKFIQNKPSYLLANIKIPITPSTSTTEAVKKQVTSFIAKNKDLKSFRTVADKLGMEIHYADNLPLFNVDIQGLERSETNAQISQWAHSNTKNGSIANRFFDIKHRKLDYTEFLLVPALAYYQKENEPSLENRNIHAEITRKLLLKKKFEYVSQQCKKMQSLGEVLEFFPDLSINHYEENQLGSYRSIYSRDPEPNLFATATYMDVGKLSPCIQGSQGIYLLVVNKRTVPARKPKEQQQHMQQLLDYDSYHKFRDSALIEDYRHEFYTNY